MGQLEKEYKYYLDHYDELLKQYDGKVLVIVGEQVVGTYDSERKAYYAAADKYPLGTFLIHKCSKDQKTYTVRYHSHVRVSNNAEIYPIINGRPIMTC